MEEIAETSSEEEDVVQGGGEVVNGEEISAMEREIREIEDEQVRQTNAYPGASNTIGSVHQRRWYLSLDRPACGFVEKRRSGRSRWELRKDEIIVNDDLGRASDSEAAEVEGKGPDRLSFPFYVRGVDHETSVVTGRRGADIMRDEGVQNFIQRKGWKPVLK